MNQGIFRSASDWDDPQQNPSTECSSLRAGPYCHLYTLQIHSFSHLLFFREALLAEMGVAMREDGGTVGVFSPKKV